MRSRGESGNRENCPTGSTPETKSWRPPRNRTMISIAQPAVIKIRRSRGPWVTECPANTARLLPCRNMRLHEAEPRTWSSTISRSGTRRSACARRRRRRIDPLRVNRAPNEPSRLTALRQSPQITDTSAPNKVATRSSGMIINIRNDPVSDATVIIRLRSSASP